MVLFLLAAPYRACIRSADGKKLLHPANTVCQSIQFRFRVIQRQRRSGRCRHTKPFHDGLRAVMAGPDGDAVAIEDGADVMWMHALEHKRDRKSVVEGRGG